MLGISLRQSLNNFFDLFTEKKNLISEAPTSDAIRVDSKDNERLIIHFHGCFVGVANTTLDG